MGKRNGALILLESGKHFQKHFLGKVLFLDPPREMSPYDADDEGEKMVHQLTRSVLIPAAHASEAASQIKRLVVRHRDREARSTT